MKLRLFHGGSGDCILVQGGGDANILSDGGHTGTMRRHLRPNLNRLLAQNGGEIAIAYVSHVDNDHISGVKELLENTLDWRVFRHHESAGDQAVSQPKFDEPPVVHTVWHNSFDDQIGQNTQPIGDLLAARAQVLAASRREEWEEIGFYNQAIATGIKEAVRVSHLTSPQLLNIPKNAIPNSPHDGKLLMARSDQDPIQIGDLKVTIIGPSDKELTKLREGWAKWMEDDGNQETIGKIRKQLADNINEFANGHHSGSPFNLGRWNGVKGEGAVSVPNIASLVLLVEEGPHRALLTGDAHHDLLLEQMEDAGLLNENGGCHLDVLKVMHHGSKNNMSEKFAQHVSADHYVFCGDGGHHNPGFEPIDQIYNSRMGDAGLRTLSPRAQGRPFKFWFSSSPDHIDPSTKKHAYFASVQTKVRAMVRESDGMLSAKFVENHYSTIDL